MLGHRRAVHLPPRCQGLHAVASLILRRELSHLLGCQPTLRLSLANVLGLCATLQQVRQTSS